jgi:hypothetical protein
VATGAWTDAMILKNTLAKNWRSFAHSSKKWIITSVEKNADFFSRKIGEDGDHNIGPPVTANRCRIAIVNERTNCIFSTN